MLSKSAAISVKAFFCLLFCWLRAETVPDFYKSRVCCFSSEFRIFPRVVRSVESGKSDGGGRSAPFTTASSIAHTICKWFVPKNVGALVKGVEVHQITKVMFYRVFGFRVRVW